ncbi:hypothetical protein [Streptomyces sp. NPDC060366]|uniref:hypothetical protein n=1 Tax=Streptomyces sp. NPDC060366 TaxID=3347105 RepID=UPI003650D102
MATWHRLAEPSDQRRALWTNGADRTRWATCGQAWDAVAITPISRGLDVLTAMCLDPRNGHPVIADQLSDVLYVLVPSGSGRAAAGLRGVRVLSTGDYLMVPTTEPGSPAAYWISPPHDTTPLRLVRTDRLIHHLNRLTPDTRRQSP